MQIRAQPVRLSVVTRRNLVHRPPTFLQHMFGICGDHVDVACQPVLDTPGVRAQKDDDVLKVWLHAQIDDPGRNILVQSGFGAGRLGPVCQQGGRIVRGTFPSLFHRHCTDANHTSDKAAVAEAA